MKAAKITLYALVASLVLVLGYHLGYFVIFSESHYAYCPDEEYSEKGIMVIAGPAPRFFPMSDIQRTGWWGTEWYFDLYRSKIRKFCEREGCDWTRFVRKEHGSIFPDAKPQKNQKYITEKSG